MIAELDYTDARAVETALDGPQATALPRDTLKALVALYKAVCAERDALDGELAEERLTPDRYDEGFEDGREAAS